MVWIVAAHVHWEMFKNHLLIKFRRAHPSGWRPASAAIAGRNSVRS